MELAVFQSDFAAIFRKNGLERFCKPEILAQFETFTRLFLAENAKTNLSAIRTPREMIAKHYADCLLAESMIPNGASVLDVGCGGGFPCVPFAIVRPDLRIVAIDSTQKKIDFVKKAANELKLANLQPLCGRIEAKEQAHFREQFDIVISRAVANLQVLAEITLPFAKIGGALLAMKGIKGSEELSEAANGIAKLGSALEIDREAMLWCPKIEAAASSDEIGDWEPETRHLLMIRKQKATPKEFPRAYAAILKRPL